MIALLMVFLAGQSAAVAAQYKLSGQQNHPTSGQHPAGHSVPSHCLELLLAAKFMILLMESLAGQSAAVAAQYKLSGQQNHPTSGQHPAGHSVPSHCWEVLLVTKWSILPWGAATANAAKARRATKTVTCSIVVFKTTHTFSAVIIFFLYSFQTLCKHIAGGKLISIY